MTKHELKPCPFCGSDDVEGVEDDSIHHVECCECGATCGFYDYKKEAAEAWNNRVNNEQR